MIPMSWVITFMPSKRPLMKLSRDEELFLLHWMYDEVHYQHVACTGFVSRTPCAASDHPPPTRPLLRLGSEVVTVVTALSDNDLRRRFSTRRCRLICHGRVRWNEVGSFDRARTGHVSARKWVRSPAACS